MRSKKENVDSGDLKLRVLITADPELPVPPKYYGGIERIIDLLALGLGSRGHDVTLLAHPESKTAGQLIPWPGKSSQKLKDTSLNAITLAQTLLSSRFDIVHSFSRVAYLAPILATKVPKVMTYQRPINPRVIDLGRRLSRGTLEFTAISEWMMKDVRMIAPWTMVPNGVSLETYTFNSKVDRNAPLVFLGRLEEIKGPHLAVEIALRTGRDLIMAGNIPDDHKSWFESEVRPFVDGRQIQYIGPVNDSEKNKLLRNAAAFLMPILWDEPFGIVMAEAMACGTPVLGFRRGAVPEIVVEGLTGFIRDDVEELVVAVDRIDELDRSACRKRVQDFYSADAIVEAYIDVYINHSARTKVEVR